jgi:hypothetical protein
VRTRRIALSITFLLMVKGAFMQATPSNATASPGERLEYEVVGGPELALGLHETEVSLRIDLGTGVAFLERHQPSSEEGGEPLGTFRAALSPDVAARLHQALGAVQLGAVAGGGGGGPGTSMLRIRHTTAAGRSEARFSSRDTAALEKLDPLIAVLDEITALLVDHPFQAVRLLVSQRKAPEGTIFDITVKNVGSEVVAVPDLAAVGRTPPGNPERGLGVRVAPFPPERPGYTAPPLQWTRLGLAPDTPPGPATEKLPPAAEKKFHTPPWKPRTAGIRHLVQATLATYEGEPVVDGRIMVRGRALSAALEFMPVR